MAIKNTRFILKDPNSKEPTLILLLLYFDKRRLVYSTRQKIEPDYWEEDKKEKKQWIAQVKRDAARNEQHKAINNVLEDYKVEVNRIFTDFDQQRIIPTIEDVKLELDKRLHRKSNTGTPSFLELIQIIIDESKSGIRQTPKGNKFSPITIKGYTTTLNHLLKFYRKSRQALDYENINLSFYRSFVKYFHDENYSTNTIGKNVKNVKVFMKEAYRRGYTKNRIFEDEDFKVMEEETDQIYLSLNELDKLYELDLKNNPKLDRVRDIFLIGCYTGLRFSDLNQLKEGNISLKDNGNFIKIRTQKTGELVQVPLHPYVLKILQKYDNKPPHVISNQKMNLYLKDLGKVAEFNNKESISITKGGLKVKTFVEKYRLITVHTARRSFATNAYLSDMPVISIMKFTGHKTEKSFMRYIRISQEDNAHKLIDHPFFRPQLKIVK